MSSASVFAQDDSLSNAEQRRQRNDLIVNLQEEEGIVKFNKQWAAGIKLANDGYGGFLEYGIYKTPRTAFLFQLDISERKHNKETRAILNYSNPNPLIYGKINFFYPVKLGMQYQLSLIHI